MSFAENLKSILTTLDVTQSELSKRTGINKAIISEYLSGKYEPKQKNLYKIATALNVKPSDLISDAIYSPTSEPDRPSYYADPETAEVAERLRTQPGMRMLFDASKDAKPEDLQYAADLLKRLKGDEG